MEKGDKGSTLTRMGVSGWMFLLVPAYPGCPGQTAVKWLLLLLYHSPGRLTGHSSHEYWLNLSLTGIKHGSLPITNFMRTLRTVISTIISRQWNNLIHNFTTVTHSIKLDITTKNVHFSETIQNHIKFPLIFMHFVSFVKFCRLKAGFSTAN